MRGIKKVPPTEEELHYILQRLNGAVRKAIYLRDVLERFYATSRRESAFVKMFPDAVRRGIARVREGNIKRQSFSDTVVISVPLTPEADRAIAVGGAFSSLAAVGSALLTLLTVGCPIRGGVDAGIGIEIEDGEVYGLVLAGAHYLESRKAEYRRIVVDDEASTT